jgi:hypothetical protein
VFTVLFGTISAYGQLGEFGLQASFGYKSRLTGVFNNIISPNIAKPDLINMAGLSYEDSIGKYDFELELLYANKGVTNFNFNEIQGRYLYGFSSEPSLILPVTYRGSIGNTTLVFGPTVSFAFGGYSFQRTVSLVGGTAPDYPIKVPKTYSNIWEDRFLFGYSIKTVHPLVQKEKYKLSLESRIIGDVLSRDGWFAATIGLKVSNSH